MRIGIDIDGVLTNIEQFLTDYMSKYCYENNISINVNLNEYDEMKAFNITKEQALKFWNLYLADYARDYKAREFAPEVVQKLKQEGNDIYIITVRNEYGLPKELYGKMNELTIAFLEKNHIYYDKLIHTKESKLPTIIDNNVNIMIDDSPKNIKEIATKIPVLCYNAGYNANIEGKNIVRVYGWYDIYEKIKKFEKKEK